jgi:hypothetical protein
MPYEDSALVNLYSHWRIVTCTATLIIYNRVILSIIKCSADECSINKRVDEDEDTMPYVVIRLIAPISKALEVARINTEDKDLVNRDVPGAESVVPTAVRATLDGGEVLSILKVANESLAQALEMSNTWIARFSRVEGCRYSIDVYYSADEAMTFFASLMQ